MKPRIPPKAQRCRQANAHRPRPAPQDPTPTPALGPGVGTDDANHPAGEGPGMMSYGGMMWLRRPFTDEVR